MFPNLGQDLTYLQAAVDKLCISLQIAT